MNVGASGQKGVNVSGGLLHVAFDIHGESGGFGNRQSEVEGNGTRNATETNEPAPAGINGVGGANLILIDNLVLVGGKDDQTDEGGTQLTEALHGKDL